MKVVHFSHNPFTQARRNRTEEMERLKEECENLRRKLKMIEEDGGLKSTNIERIVIDEPSPDHVKGER